jgi:predicted ATP-dependent serine protease
MIIISGGRGIGKTKLLLETAKAEGGVIVCRDPDLMRERAHKYGITGLNIISYEDVAIFKVAYPDKKNILYIHNINKFLETQFSSVKGYSLSID